MSKQVQAPVETPPTLTKVHGLKVLRSMKEKGEQILKQRPISEESFDTWSQTAFDYLKQIYGSDSGHLRIFGGQGRIQFGNVSEQYLERTRAKDLTSRIEVLKNLVEGLSTAIELESDMVSLPCTDGVWSLLHADVVRTAKGRFDAGHYADAVEAALKELNSAIKDLVKKSTGKELDGADLMHQALSPKTPIIILDDLGTESGRNQQTGYMEIFAGAMTGIRNPKAHENLTITKERAIHHLFLASLLFHRLNERTNLK